MFLPDGSVAKFGSVVLIMVVSGADEVAKWIPGDGPQALWSPLVQPLPLPTQSKRWAVGRPVRARVGSKGDREGHMYLLIGTVGSIEVCDLHQLGMAMEKQNRESRPIPKYYKHRDTALQCFLLERPLEAS